MCNLGFSKSSLMLRPSITHGTRARILELNQLRGNNENVIDLSIGTLDSVADKRIDNNLIDYIHNHADVLHGFAPVPGFDFLRQAISDRVERVRNIHYNPDTEIMVTPGGIKGSITVVFHTLLDPEDEVIVPLPNWPHYADMIELHGAKMKGVFVEDFRHKGLSPEALKQAITPRTKMLILGDSINPSGKIYNHDELQALSEVIAEHNSKSIETGLSPIHVLYDCPYEAHILKSKPSTISNLSVTLETGKVYKMRSCTTIVTGPGKTYGMHGDRIGYICTDSAYLETMSKVQVNLNSFASTYSQIATFTAMQDYMDEVATARAISARENLQSFIDKLNSIDGVDAPCPDGGYFIFVDLTSYAEKIKQAGFETADAFILNEGLVASVGGQHFAEDVPQLKFFIRLNCGRSEAVLLKAAERIFNVLRDL